MGYRLREFDAESKFIDELTVEAIGRAVPMTEVKAVIEETGTQQVRERKLPMVAIVFLVIAMGSGM
jgi:hypothetical protein